MNTPAPIYLCLDLNCAYGPQLNVDQLSILATHSAADIMVDKAVNSGDDVWVRTWRCFADRSEALRYASYSPTLIVIPLQPQDVIALGELPG